MHFTTLIAGQMAMEQSQIRTGALGIIKERVAKTVAQRLDDKQVLQLAIACGMRGLRHRLPANTVPGVLRSLSVAEGRVRLRLRLRIGT